MTGLFFDKELHAVGVGANDREAVTVFISDAERRLAVNARCSPRCGNASKSLERCVIQVLDDDVVVDNRDVVVAVGDANSCCVGFAVVEDNRVREVAADRVALLEAVDLRDALAAVDHEEQTVSIASRHANRVIGRVAEEVVFARAADTDD